MLSLSPPFFKCKPFPKPITTPNRLRVSAAAAAAAGAIPSTMYEILSVAETARPDEIKAAYRRQALRWHPDTCRSALGDDERRRCAERFMLAREAYEVLSDPARRLSYNRALSADRWATAVGAGLAFCKERAGERTRTAGFGDWEAQLEGLRRRSEAAAAGEATWGERMRRIRRADAAVRAV